MSEQGYTVLLYVKEGRDLPPMDRNGLADPYCRVMVAGKRECKTATISNNLNPKWEPPGEAKCTVNMLESVNVEVEVWDKDHISPDDFMGVIKPVIPTSIEGKSYYNEQWYKLEPRHGKPAEPRGELLMGVKIQPAGALTTDSVGLPSTYKDNSQDEVIITRLKQEISPMALFMAMPRVMIVMKRKAQQAKERLKLQSQSKDSLGSLESHSVIDISKQQPNEFRQLEDRLKALGLHQAEMEGDGNCQFRSISHQLYGTQEQHDKVRALIVQYMRDNSESFMFYFDGEAEYNAFLDKMSKSRTWGDELTLKAACDVFGTEVHVVTSTLDNWHLTYTPESGDSTMPKKIFVCYISPLHYNSIEVAQ